MQPPGGGQNNVDPRFLSLFSIFTLIFPSLENLERIYNSILKAHVVSFDNPDITEMVSRIGSGTLKLYNQICE